VFAETAASRTHCKDVDVRICRLLVIFGNLVDASCEGVEELRVLGALSTRSKLYEVLPGHTVDIIYNSPLITEKP
jgi:hypothetical protein